VLSGGERSRLELLKLLLSPKNLLVLDEPTNHLDMTSKAVLLDALCEYSGTVVFVSHDRYFIEELAGSVLELRPPGVKGKRARLFPGDYGYYRRRMEQEAAETPSAETQTESPRPKRSTTARDHAEAKRRRNQIRRLEKREEALLREIEELETAKTGIEQELADPRVYTDGDAAKAVQDRLTEVERELSDRHTEWETISEELEAVNEQ
jgi:ATP-binding cassette subfamily F protein 3